MRIIPLQAIAAQNLGVILAAQATTIRVYQKFFGLYIDVLVNDVLIIGGVIGRDRNRIVRSEYLGFIGDLTFIDMQGGHDPDYTELGERYLLVYLDDSELTQFGIT